MTIIALAVASVFMFLLTYGATYLIEDFHLTITALAVPTVFMFLLTYGESLADDVERKYGLLKGRAARAVLLIVPTVVLAMADWKLAAAGWSLRAILECVTKFGTERLYTPRDPKELPIAELERALETGLTGEALANDIAQRRATHLETLEAPPKR